MPENIQLAVIRFASTVAWMSEYPGANVSEIAAHFHRTRRQVYRGIEYLASVEDSPPGAPFKLDQELYEQEQRVPLRSALGTSTPLRLFTPEAQALLIGLSAITPLLGMDLTAHVPHVVLVVCALGGLKEANAKQHMEAIPSLTLLSESLEVLHDALLHEKRVPFTYVSASDVRTYRIVDLWSPEVSASDWLLRGWCTRAGEARSFAVISISDMCGEGPCVEESRRMRYDAPTRTLDVNRDTRWIADKYDSHVAAELDGGGARITLPVWNEQRGMSLLIDIAPHLRAATPDMRDETAHHARSVLSAWTQEDAS